MSPRHPLAFALAVALFTLGAGIATAQPATAADPKDKQIRELREQVRKLEARLADLEKRLAPLLAKQEPGADAGTAEAPTEAPAEVSAEAPAEPDDAAAVATEAQRAKLVARARQRMRRDNEKYSREQLKEAEDLYQVANNNWRSDEAKESLRQMVKKFPNVNRTGCATLYLGQMAQGEEKEKLLTDAANKYADCFFGNGVQVGPYARYLLGLHYRNLGQDDKAKQLFEEIRRKHPDAIGHRGELLVQRLPKD